MPVKPLKIMVAVGARPNYMKAAPLIHALTDASFTGRFDWPPIEIHLVHTGQHYEDSLSKVLFEELSLPLADINLNVGSGSHGRQTGLIMERFEPVLEEWWPDVLVVVGDVNSTLACALVAAKSYRRLPGGGWKRPRIAHVEAGLRSFDPTMPEETNRRLTDALSDDLFIHSPEARENLLQEGAADDSILEVGNLMIDTLDRLLPIARKSDVTRRLGLGDDFRPDGKKPFALLTLHRPSNVDDPETFQKLLRGVARISPNLEIIFPVHPRVCGTVYPILESLANRCEEPMAPIRAVEPLGYLDFIALMEQATLVLTDSGGVQEETTALGVPCLTLRENTERPITVTVGTNILVGTAEERIVEAGRSVLDGKAKSGGRPPLWDGRAGERAAKLLVERALKAEPIRPASNATNLP
jgi:UDP-N-acetylglucosamine 2-epimerase (non-hydrolysing)